jgi:hypothetical protein
LSAREIQLYNDRIVQARTWGETEIPLTKAGLTQNQRSKTKSIFDREEKAYKNWFVRTAFFWKIIVYDETLPDPKDVKKFNYLLAYLSRRRIQELEGDLDKLIRDGGSPRVITNDTPIDSIFSQDDREEAAFNRSASRAVLFACLALLAPAICLLLFFRWR